LLSSKTPLQRWGLFYAPPRSFDALPAFDGRLTRRLQVSSALAHLSATIK